MKISNQKFHNRKGSIETVPIQRDDIFGNSYTGGDPEENKASPQRFDPKLKGLLPINKGSSHNLEGRQIKTERRSPNHDVVFGDDR